METEFFALSLKDVCKRTALCKAYIYQLIALKSFPAPARVGRRVIWNEAEITAWLAARFAERDAEAAA